MQEKAGLMGGEYPRLLGVELSGPILSELSRTDAINKPRIENRSENHLMLLFHLMTLLQKYKLKHCAAHGTFRYLSFA
jgi:hypothetical protein